MERREIREGMEVLIRPASPRRHSRRVARVERVEELPGYRRHRARIRYADTGEQASVPLGRVQRP